MNHERRTFVSPTKQLHRESGWIVIFTIAVVSTIIWFIAPYGRDKRPRIPADPAAAFFDVFDLVETMTHRLIDTTAIVEMDVDNRGRLLLRTNRRSVFILNHSTGDVAQLDLSACGEHRTLLARYARFGHDDGPVITQQYTSRTYRFEPEGGCDEALHHDFAPPGAFAVSDHGRFYAYHPLPSVPTLRVYDLYGEALGDVLLESSRPFLNGRIGMGGVEVVESMVFVSLPLSPYLARVGDEGVTQLGWQPRSFRMYTGGDLITPTFDRRWFEPMEYIAGSSISREILDLGNGVLLHQHTNVYRDIGQPDRYSINIMDLEGNPRSTFQVLTNIPFLAARNGKAYRVRKLLDGKVPGKQVVEVFQMREQNSIQ